LQLPQACIKSKEMSEQSTVRIITHSTQPGGNRTKYGIALREIPVSHFTGIIDTRSGGHAEYKIGNIDSNELCQTCAKL
jgi:hypothetical protein